jgi:hypothetical protein
MKFITIGGVPAAGKTYTSKLLAKQYNFLALEFESLRWDFFNNNPEENLYKYTQHTFLLENENMREYYLRCALYENRIPLELLVEWHKSTMEFINEKLYIIISELKSINTEIDYINFYNKYKKIINYMPKFKDLNRNYVIFSHAFINTIDFSKDERIQINFTTDKKILIERFKQRENIIENTFDKNIELYYKSYEAVLKDRVYNTLDTADKDIIEKINNLILNNYKLERKILAWI